MPWARGSMIWYSVDKPISSQDIYNSSTDTAKRLLNSTWWVDILPTISLQHTMQYSQMTP